MIGIVNYGAGNTASVSYALERLGVPFILSNSAAELEKCSKIIFPGVGSAEAAMNKLKEYELIDYLKNTRKPLLGICLGMQMFASFSEEGNIECLNIIETKCLKFRDKNVKIPNMGWSSITLESSSRLFEGIPAGAYFYFAHSFYIPLNNYTIAASENGQPFTASLRKDNFYGVQFHPEKSSDAGMKVLNNFVEII